jgi:hypothetical protein
MTIISQGYYTSNQETVGLERESELRIVDKHLSDHLLKMDALTTEMQTMLEGILPEPERKEALELPRAAQGKGLIEQISGKVDDFSIMSSRLECILGRIRRIGG